MGNANTRPVRRITAQDRAVLDMKLQRDRLQQYQKRIQSVLDREYEIARECLDRGDKERALLALRKRKYQSQLLAKTDGQLETLEKLTQSIEFALVEKDVLFGLEQGSRVLREINREMSIEKVEKLLDDSAAGISYQNEVSDMLANAITNQEEDEIEDELETLQREEASYSHSLTTVFLTEISQNEPTEAESEESEEEEEPVVSQKSASRNRNRQQPVLA
ncbi:Snf7-domain-containing protein [Limtongia smithiae]|uniref:Snf7-domain-containing protein n=1 Tax=Limtongia smithiae TaxID=1125753 RepID=UPI0034CD8666